MERRIAIAKPHPVVQINIFQLFEALNRNARRPSKVNLQ
jgi:hypothetical protein